MKTLSARSAIRDSRYGIRDLSFLILHSSFLILILFSCSPAKRLERLVSRHPELRHPDTLIVRDTLITPSVRADTTLHLEQLYDTVILEKERLQVKLLRISDTLYVEGNCLPDTIYYEKQIPVERINLVREPLLWRTLKPLFWILAAGVLLMLLIKVAR